MPENKKYIPPEVQSTETQTVHEEQLQPKQTLAKRSYDEVLEWYKKVKSQSPANFFALERDIIGLIHDMEEDRDNPLIDEYPEWKQEDFIKLLDELGTKYVKPENKEKIREHARLSILLSEKEKILRGQELFEGGLKIKKGDPITIPFEKDYERKLEDLRYNLADEQVKLDEMSFLDKNIFNRGTANFIKETCKKIQIEIDEFVEQIKISPLEARQAEQLQIKGGHTKGRAEERQILKNEIAEIKNRIAELDNELK